MSNYRFGTRDALIIAMICFSVVLGGSGSFYPAVETACALSIVIFAYAIWIRDTPPLDARVLWFAGLLLAIPALQLIPLPPIVWEHLPGRQGVQESLAAVGRSGAWQPLTIAPSLTWRSLLFTMAPIICLMMVSTLDESGRRTVLLGIALSCALSAFAGFIQATSPVSGTFTFYNDINPNGSRFIYGLNANHNATADQMLVGLMAASAWFATFERRGPASLRLLIFIACDVFFISAAVFTGSRTGIALIPIAIIVQALLLLKGRSRPPWQLIASGVAIICVVTAGVWLAADHSEPLRNIIQRYANRQDLRADIWKDTLEAIRTYGWTGSGFGTLVPALQQAERLEVINTTFTLHAHDEYLEYTLEVGALGWISLLLAVGLLARRGIRRWRVDGIKQRNEILFFIGTLAVISLHSLVDHPFRNMALATVLALATGLVFGAPHEVAETEKAS